LAPPALQHAQHSPFVRHSLPGWRPTLPHMRYPATFGMVQEGDNLALYLAPADLRSTRRSIGLPADARALVLEEARVLKGDLLMRPEPSRVVRWAEIDQLQGEVGLIHLPGRLSVDLDELALPSHILAAPDHAVPTEIGSRLALGLNDRCHVVVISPEADLIEAALQGFIDDYLRCASLLSGPMPQLPPALLRAAASTALPGAWHELMLRTHSRYWTLDIVPHGTETDPIRWVSEGPRGHWRGGWAW
jgi:hypothetical protein